MGKITVFERCTKPNKPFYTNPVLVYNYIKSGRYKESIDKIRFETDKDKRNELKTSLLPAICWSGEFSRRANDAIIKHSGLICIDFDHVKDLSGLRNRLETDQYTYMLFLSPSGDGLKVIIKIPDNTETHKESWIALKEYYGVDEIDEAAKDISRVCFASYDPDTYINTDSKVFINLLEEKKKEYKQKSYPKERVNNSKDVFNKIISWVEKTNLFIDGNRNNYIFQVASACLRFGITENECYTILNFKHSDDFSTEEIRKTVNGVYKNYSSSACTAYFKEDGEPVYTATKEKIKEDFFNIDLAEKDVIYLDNVKQSMFEGFLSGRARGTTTYYKSFDKHWTWRKRELTFVGGIGNMGKTIFMNNLCVLKAMYEDWKFAIFSPEQDPPDDFYNDLIHTYVGKSTEPYHSNQMTKDEYEQGMSFISSHFFYIYPETESPTPDYINNCFSYAIKKHNIDVCIVDPFNQLDNDWKKFGRDDLYISEFLSKNKRFSQANNVAYLIAGHPKGNLEKTGGNYAMPNVYDYSGGAMWNNKCDNILCYHRPFAITEPESTECVFISQKIKKRKLTGIPGAVKMSFDIRANRFIEESGENPFIPANARLEHEQKIIQSFYDKDFEQDENEPPY
jgi:hypothetical protein